MESGNIVTAREMVYDGNWIAPTMNGELRLEKPPLPTWLTAVVEMIAPDNLGWQRGVAGLAALLLVFYFYCFVKNILGVAPFVSALILCTCHNVILMGRTASWDIYCHAFMLGAVYHLVWSGLRMRVSYMENKGTGILFYFLEQYPRPFVLTIFNPIKYVRSVF
jgi:4-amino-4-deoxy-L-arabinose transferase-like glycosyltransferase